MSSKTGTLPSVTGLLSIYEGRAYLPALLESLTAQREVDLALEYVLDDGDLWAAELVQQFCPNARPVAVQPGAGVPASYLELLRRAQSRSDFYCFVDQDDIWNKDKLREAADALSQYGSKPALWVCRVTPFRTYDGTQIDEGVHPRWIPRPSWRNALVENIGPGCAMVWNRGLHEILTSRHTPGGILMHDWWVYAVASTVGQVIVEPRALVRYRLHGGNAVGIDNSPLSRFRRWHRARSNANATIETQARALLAAYDDLMSDEQRECTWSVASGHRTNNFMLAARGRIYRHRRSDYPLLCARMLLP